MHILKGKQYIIMGEEFEIMSVRYITLNIVLQNEQ
jgi:hypothetical protein